MMGAEEIAESIESLITDVEQHNPPELREFFQERATIKREPRE